MKRFASLHRALEETARAGEREALLTAYFRQAPAADAAWAASFLAGPRPRRAVAPAQLRAWAAEVAALPPWLVEESQRSVGDSAETVAHLLESLAGDRQWPLHRLVAERLLPLAAATGDAKRALLQDTWRELPGDQHLLWNRLVGGTFRPGVTVGAVARALAAALGGDAATVAQRLAGPWVPSARVLGDLVAAGGVSGAAAGAYPFQLAEALVSEPQSLGAVAGWLAEWHWGGLRVQLRRQQGEPALWSRAGELVTSSHREVAAAAAALPPGTVLDGQLVSLDAARRLLDAEALDAEALDAQALDARGLDAQGLDPRAQLAAPGDAPAARTRGRTRTHAATPAPMAFVAFDLLQHGGDDWRSRPLAERRQALEALLTGLAQPSLVPSPRLAATSWDDLDELRRGARERGAEGLLLKRLDSPYGAGRDGGAWWKWRAAQHTVEAVLVYAQRGAAERASHYVDYTFALWHDGELVPVAKASGGLPAAEVEELDRWVRRSIVDRFGPVRQVRPELVFELGFDSVQASSRHKAGLTLRAPRVLRWVRQRAAAQAATLQQLRELLPGPT